MKKILLLAVCLSLASGLFAQNYTREGKQFTSTTTVRQSSEGEKTGYTWKDSKGNVYDIYITKNNSCYTIRTSKKTGKEYRAYLPKEVSAEIAKELGRIDK